MDLVVTAVFRTQWPGDCRVCHKRFRPGTKVAKVERADNPFLPVGGVICESCTREYPRKPM